jgi:heme-degrading monooxygenase HmoA
MARIVGLQHGRHRSGSALRRLPLAMAMGDGRWRCTIGARTPDGGLTVILEIADIRIHPSQQAGFEEAVQRGIATVISKAQGYKGYKVNKGVESPERYVLMIFWETLEDHTVGFREGPLFPAWRAIVGPFFAAPPQVEHFTLVAKSA